MTKEIAIAEAQQNFDKIVGEVETSQTLYVLTRDNRPAVVMISYDEYTKFRSRQAIWEQFKRSWEQIGKETEHFSEKEVEADVEAAIKEYRESRQK